MSKIKLPEGVGIAIQGPTERAEEMIVFWNQFNCPVVWGTWNDEPARNILKIERSGIEVILIDKPVYAGYLNCNMQFKSSLYSLQNLKQKGVKHALKVRHDCLFHNIENIWPINAEISFQCSYNPNQSWEIAYRLPKDLKCAIGDGKFHMGVDFPPDFCIFGDIDILIKVFDLYMGWSQPIPPESLILKQWLDLKGLEDNFTPEFLKSNGLHYFGPDTLKMGASLIWLKNNWNMTEALREQPLIRIF
jgi:hypothetical protein